MATRMMVTPTSPLCPDCVGYGSKQNIGSQTACERCGGAGRLPVAVEIVEMEVCQVCRGTGQVESGKPGSTGYVYAEMQRLAAIPRPIDPPVDPPVVAPPGLNESPQAV